MKEQWFVPRDINRVPVRLINPPIPRCKNKKTTKYLLRLCLDYLNNFYNFCNNFGDEITIIFISEFEDISYFHYKGQPRSMLCRKLEKFF